MSEPIQLDLPLNNLVRKSENIDSPSKAIFFLHGFGQKSILAQNGPIWTLQTYHKVCIARNFEMDRMGRVPGPKTNILCCFVEIRFSAKTM